MEVNLFIKQLERDIDHCEKLGLNGGAAYVVSRSKKSRIAYKVKTAFGLCEIMNVKEKEDKIDICFRPTLKQMKKLLKKLKGEIK